MGKIIGKKVKFENLSTMLKVAIIFSWIFAGIYVVSFIIGFFRGLAL